MIDLTSNPQHSECGVDLIILMPDGSRRAWILGAHPSLDCRHTLEKHVQKYIPGGKLESFRFWGRRAVMCMK